MRKYCEQFKGRQGFGLYEAGPLCCASIVTPRRPTPRRLGEREAPLLPLSSQPLAALRQGLGGCYTLTLIKTDNLLK